jgi:hypothetical protein
MNPTLASLKTKNPPLALAKDFFGNLPYYRPKQNGKCLVANI